MSESGFYDVRDDLVGGSDTIWSPDWDGEDGRLEASVDMRRGGEGQASFGGNLSQADLAN